MDWPHRSGVRPIRPDLAELLLVWIATTSAAPRVCPVHARAAWIAGALADRERQERERSDFPRHTDRAGRVVGLHGLRHTFVSLLPASGASVSVAQELARHATPALTIGKYAQARLHDLTAALDALPSPVTTAPQAATLRATGPDDSSAG